jgi:spore coat protein H
LLFFFYFYSMIRIFFFFFLLTFVASCVDDSSHVDRRDPSYVFDINALPDVYLHVSVEEWNKLLNYYDQNPHNEECVEASFRFTKNGEMDMLKMVGLRLRGNTSRRRPEGRKGEMHQASNPDWHHASFSVDINRFVPGQRYAGLKKINLKWFKDDAMYVREVYCYDLFKRYGVWTAPRSSYCRLFIQVGNGAKTAYFGVYQLLEAVDTDFIGSRSRLFNTQQGFLWKGNWGANFRVADRSKMDIERVTLTDNYEPVYDLKNRPEELQSARNQLVEFIAFFNSKKGDAFKDWVQTRMDVPLFLRTYAVNVICGMWDDYWNNQNNFYFYFNTSGEFYFIPYDYDNTLGTSLLMHDAGRQDPLNWGDHRNPLVVKLLEIEEFRELYITYLRELIDPDKELFDQQKSIQRIRKWHAMIEEHIPNDTGEDMELKDRPASWGNCGFYRLLHPVNNYFAIRAAHIP